VAHLASNPKGDGVSSPGLKQLGREAGHSPPTNAEVKKTFKERHLMCDKFTFAYSVTDFLSHAFAVCNFLLAYFS
jgi:hypothetical protein